MFFPLGDAPNNSPTRPWVNYGLIAVNVLVYLWALSARSADGAYVMWSGCLHLDRDSGNKLSQKDYSLKLRDGRLGQISIRKVVSTNGALHVEVLFEGRRRHG